MCRNHGIHLENAVRRSLPGSDNTPILTRHKETNPLCGKRGENTSGKTKRVSQVVDTRRVAWLRAG